MLRIRALPDAAAALSYYGKTDSGSEYYLGSPEMHREVGGQAAKLLGLGKEPDFQQFERLLNGLDPHTGEQLTAKIVEGRLAGWDITASIPKGVTVALEAGDPRIHDALWEAGRETMADIERFIATRVRKGGRQEDRVTGNMLWHAFEHPETRPAKQDGMPDMDRHIHFVIGNLTWDKEEQQWKAVKIHDVYELRKLFDCKFDSRLASKLTDLGYEIETKYRQGKYYSWDIKSMPKSVIAKFSRRSQEVEKLAKELGVISPMGKDKLGATSRLSKRKDLTLEDYRKYWLAKITPLEAQQISDVIGAAREGANPKPENTVDKAVEYALQHHFYRDSVVPMTALQITALERSMGAAKPEDIRPEMVRQGLLERDGQGTTREVLGQEGRIIAFARESRGTMRPLGFGGTVFIGSSIPASAHQEINNGTLSPDQQGDLQSNKIKQAKQADGENHGSKTPQLSKDQLAAVRHIWSSSDQVILIRGGAGTGKTTMMKTAIAGIDKAVAVLAPSAEASRGVLRRDGFQDANTVTAFLGDRRWQEKTRKGVIWVDEASLLPIRDLDQLVGVAKALDAKLILQGDPKQHKSPARHGNIFPVLQEYAGLPLAELKEVKRQKGRYKEAAEAFQQGDPVKGVNILDDMGWVQYVAPDDVTKAIADKYWENIQKKQPSVVSGITHKQNEEITAELRARLKLAGKIGKEEVQLPRLKPLHWSDAQKLDFQHQYEGTEVIQLFKGIEFERDGKKVALKGKVTVSDMLDYLKWRNRRHRGPRSKKPPVRAEDFAVYSPATIGLSEGDMIRATAGGKTLDGRRIDNGDVFTFLGLTDKKDLRVTTGKNEYAISSQFMHIDHALVRTSQKVQGRTDPTVITALTRQALPAFRAEHGYVDVSRGQKEATIVTDLSPMELREAIRRQDERKSATELMRPKNRMRIFMKRYLEVYRRLRDRAADVIKGKDHEREAHAR